MLFISELKVSIHCLISLLRYQDCCEMRAYDWAGKVMLVGCSNGHITFFRYNSKEDFQKSDTPITWEQIKRESFKRGFESVEKDITSHKDKN